MLIHELRDSSVVMLALTENELSIRIDAGENGRRRINHKVISFIGHGESAGVL